MAKQKGIIRLKGSLGGITFYQSNGENLSREQNGPDKDKVMNDPNFARTRENMQEFGGAATIAKAIRIGLVQEFKEMSDFATAGRLNRLVKQIMNRDITGLRGQRAFAPVTYKSMFVNFTFSERNPYDSVFLAPFTAVTNAGRSEVTITVPPFNSANMVHAPSGATHFKIINLVSTISQFNFNLITKKYDPLDVSNSKNAFNASNYIQVGATVATPTTIVSTITPVPTLLATTALLSCIGIEFYQQLGTNYYLLASSNAMKIQNVY